MALTGRVGSIPTLGTLVSVAVWHAVRVVVTDGTEFVTKSAYRLLRCRRMKVLVQVVQMQISVKAESEE